MVDGEKFRVRREGRGIFSVAAPSPLRAGRVSYTDVPPRLLIDRPDLPESPEEIRFRLKGTVFEWRGLSYRVELTGEGLVTIDEHDHSVVRGEFVLDGVFLNHMGPEFCPIVRELALGLALRRLVLAKEWHSERAPEGGPVGYP